MRRHPWTLPVLLVGAVVGLAVGLGAAAWQPTRYRAVVTLVLVRDGHPLVAEPETGRITRTYAELLRGEVVTANVVTALHLHGSGADLARRISVATTAGTPVLRVGVAASRQAEANRTAQQLAAVFGVIVAARFTSGPTVQVFDPVHAEGRTSKHGWKLAFLWMLGGLAVAGGGLALVDRARAPGSSRTRGRVTSRFPAPAATPPPPCEPVDAITEPEPEPALEASAPEPEPQAQPEPGPPVLEPIPGRFSMRALARRVEERAPDHPAEAEDWRAYVVAFAAQAEGDLLPAPLASLVREVFEPILD